MRFANLRISIVACLLAVTVFPAVAAAGSLKLTITGNGGAPIVAEDGLASDGLWAFPGLVQGSQIGLAGFIQGTGQSKPFSGSGETANLHLDGWFTVRQAGQVQLTLQDSGFEVGLSQQALVLNNWLSAGFTPSIPGGGGATFTAKSWVETPDGTTYLPLTVSNAGFASSYADFLTSGAYSLFSQITIDFAGPGTGSFNLDTSVPVPEPGTLMLFGTGLLGIARAVRRRRQIA